MKKPIRPPGTAFTLLELLIAASIFLVVMLTVYSSFHTGIFGYRNIDQAIGAHQAARQVLGRMNLDLRNSFAFSDTEARFTGSKTDLSFCALVDTFSIDALHKEYAVVLYKLEGDKLMRSCRKNKEAFNGKTKLEPEELASGIETIDFSYGYLEGAGKPLKFKDSWALQDDFPDEKARLPAAVKITLAFKDKVNRDFQRLIYIPVTGPDE